jgi:hypothetical protein
MCRPRLFWTAGGLYGWVQIKYHFQNVRQQSKQTSVGCKADPPEGRKILQSLADTQGTGVVDRGLDRQSSSFFEVLLDPGALVVDVQRGITPSVITRVRKRPGVLRVTLRLKFNAAISWFGLSPIVPIRLRSKFLLLAVEE